jgi:hypothetical protein
MSVAEALHMLGATACLAACGSGGLSSDAGLDVVYGHKSLDAGVYEAAPPETQPGPGPWNRMEPHEGIVLATPHIEAIYISSGGDGSPSFDSYLTWLVGSTDYWSILAQYGVGYGTFGGSVQVDSAAFFTPGMVTAGVVDWEVLSARVNAVIHQSPSDAGADDGGGDAAVPLPLIPSADGYVFFLPSDVTVNLDAEGLTCQGTAAYHDYDGDEPFAIIPSCGRFTQAVSHEVAEMCTDPVPGLGWYSDADVSNAGGEVGDLCNFPVQLGPNVATGLWSNKDGECEPAP